MNTLREVIATQIKYRKQIFKLAKADIVKTYSGTILGWSWAIIRPAILICIYYVAIVSGLRAAREVPGGYPYFMWLLTGLVPWFYIRSVFTGGAGSIRKYKYLVTKIKFPICVIPTIESFSQFLVNLPLVIIMLGYIIIAGKGPSIYWLQLPLYMAMMLLFFSTWSLFAGMLCSISKDFQQLIRSVVMAFFWLSGIIFDLSNVDNSLFRAILMINPITTIVNGYRKTLIYKEWFWEDWTVLLTFVIAYAVMMGLALFVYKRLKDDIADVL